MPPRRRRKPEGAQVIGRIERVEPGRPTLRRLRLRFAAASPQCGERGEGAGQPGQFRAPGEGLAALTGLIGTKPGITAIAIEMLGHCAPRGKGRQSRGDDRPSRPSPRSRGVAGSPPGRNGGDKQRQGRDEVQHQKFSCLAWAPAAPEHSAHQCKADAKARRVDIVIEQIFAVADKALTEEIQVRPAAQQSVERIG